MKLAKIFPSKLRQLRQDAGLSQESLAELANLDRTSISLLERGLRSPSLITLERIAVALNMPLSRLIVHLEQSSPSIEEEFSHSLFDIDISIVEHMLHGMAYCKMLFKDGLPVDFIYLYTNATFTELTGLSDVVGKRISEIFPDFRQTSSELLETYGQVSLGAPPMKFETFSPPLSKWFLISVYSPKNEHFVALFDVINEKKETESALMKANKRLALAQMTSSSGTWDWDISTGKLVWTEELFRIFGLDSNQTEASFDIWRKLVHPDDLDMAEEKIREAIISHEQLWNEYRIITPSGDVKLIKAVGNSEYDDHGRAIRMIGICIDITNHSKQFS